MSKAFRSFFQKKDSKDNKDKRHSTKKGVIYIEAEPSHKTAKDIQIRKYKQRQRKSSDSLSKNDPIHLNKVFGLNKGGTIRVINKTPEDKYSPHQRFDRKSTDRNCDNSIYSKNVPMVYAASVTRDSTNFMPRNTSRPSEPFPYKVYDPVPRRSTLHYGVDFDGKPLNSDGSRRYSSFEDYLAQSIIQNDGVNVPNEQNFKYDTDRSPQQSRRVTIIAPSDKCDTSSANHGNEKKDFQRESVGKTVLRFRPHSSVNRSPRESVKLMVFRADQTEPSPMVLGRHVHDMPVKKVKHTPVLVTDDGKLLKPIDTNSYSVNREETSQVRLSMADIERVSRLGRKSTEAEPPVYYPRNSVNRNSVRQSLLPTQNERRSTIVRKSCVAPEVAFHYSSEANNKPMIYAVPVVPSRNRSHSLLERQSTTQHGFKQNQLRESLSKSSRYSVDSHRIVDNESRFSTVLYQPDGIKTKKGKSIVVYEVHNLVENNSAKKSIDKNSEKTHSLTSKNKTTKHPAKPRVETNDQEPKTHQGIISKIKSKTSFKRRISVDKSPESSTNDSMPTYQQQTVVHGAEAPSNNCSFKRKSRTSDCKGKQMQNADYCGLACENDGKDKSSNKKRISHNNGVSSPQQANVENDIDFLCYPAEKLESDSKLKWRVIIKKEQN